MLGAGKSKKVSSASASFSGVATAFGYLAPYSVANRRAASSVMQFVVDAIEEKLARGQKGRKRA